MKKGKTFKFIEEIRNKIHLKINKLCVKNIIKFILYKGERLQYMYLYLPNFLFILEYSPSFIKFEFDDMGNMIETN